MPPPNTLEKMQRQFAEGLLSSYGKFVKTGGLVGKAVRSVPAGTGRRLLKTAKHAAIGALGGGVAGGVAGAAGGAAYGGLKDAARGVQYARMFPPKTPDDYPGYEPPSKLKMAGVMGGIGALKHATGGLVSGGVSGAVAGAISGGIHGWSSSGGKPKTARPRMKKPNTAANFHSKFSEGLLGEVNRQQIKEGRTLSALGGALKGGLKGGLAGAGVGGLSGSGVGAAFGAGHGADKMHTNHKNYDASSFAKTLGTSTRGERAKDIGIAAAKHGVGGAIGGGLIGAGIGGVAGAGLGAVRGAIKGWRSGGQSAPKPAAPAMKTPKIHKPKLKSAGVKKMKEGLLGAAVKGTLGAVKGGVKGLAAGSVAGGAGAGLTSGSLKHAGIGAGIGGLVGGAGGAAYGGIKGGIKGLFGLGKK